MSVGKETNVFITYHEICSLFYLPLASSPGSPPRAMLMCDRNPRGGKGRA